MHILILFLDAINFAYSRWWVAAACTLAALARLWFGLHDHSIEGVALGWRYVALVIDIVWLWDVTYGPTSEKNRG